MNSDKSVIPAFLTKDHMKEMAKFSLVEIFGFCCHSLFHLRSGELEPLILHASTAFMRVKQAVQRKLIFFILSLIF